MFRRRTPDPGGIQGEPIVFLTGWTVGLRRKNTGPRSNKIEQFKTRHKEYEFTGFTEEKYLCTR